MSGLLVCVLQQTGLSWQLGWRRVGGDGQGVGLGGQELWGEHRLSAEHGGPIFTFLLDLCPALRHPAGRTALG